MTANAANPVTAATPSRAVESNPALPNRLRSLTPARIGLRRAGESLATRELLDFQLAHARARDAVQAQLQPGLLLDRLRALPFHAMDKLLLHSSAPNRQIYLQRPDLGRKLDQPSLHRLQDRRQPIDSPCFDLSIILVDGLSPLAVERHAIPLLTELLPALTRSSPWLNLAPLCIVEQGRVAIGDEIAHALAASLAVVLIGERPGLSSPDSLGAYIAWRPQPGQTADAERNCISNIRPEGLSYPRAAARLLFYICEARKMRLTGVALKDPHTEHEAAGLETGKPL
jgi:ethanolamine ammonia-lyase small subunit